MSFSLPMMRYSSFLLIVSLSFLTDPLLAQNPEVVDLYESSSSELSNTADEDVPKLTVYLPEASSQKTPAIIICPGGGYSGLAMDHEGHQVAKWLNSLGIAGIIVNYRRGIPHPHPTPIFDATNAIAMTRLHADQWNIDSSKVGILGFSAGGHLAGSTGIYPGLVGGLTFAEREKPDFMLMIYPVVSMTTDYIHKGSRRYLLTEDVDWIEANLLSLEKQVTENTPPTFLTSTADDQAVPVENSTHLFLALKKAGVPSEFHIYESGRHGLGLGPKDNSFSDWPSRAEEWLKTRGILK